MQAVTSLVRLGHADDLAAVRERLRDSKESRPVALAAARQLAGVEGESVLNDMKSLRRRLKKTADDSPSERGLDRLIQRVQSGEGPEPPNPRINADCRPSALRTGTIKGCLRNRSDR